MGRETGEMAMWGAGHCYLLHQSVSGISTSNSETKVRVDAIVELPMEENELVLSQMQENHIGFQIYFRICLPSTDFQ